MVDVIPALPPVVSHWHLVRQLRPTLDAADGRPPARLRELHTRRESADGLIEGPENQKPRKSLNLRGFAIISGGERVRHLTRFFDLSPLLLMIRAADLHKT